MIKRWKLSGVAAALVALLVVFQNCSKGASHSNASIHNSQSSSLSGGDGYDGKTFINQTSTLCPDGSSIESQINIDANGNAFQVRANCAALNPPVALTADQFSYMPHNPNNLIFGLHTFDLAPPSLANFAATTWLCRGFETAMSDLFLGVTDPPDLPDRWADFVIRPDGQGGYTMRFLLGLYAQGSTTQLVDPVIDSGEFPVAASAVTSIPIVFSGVDPLGANYSIGTVLKSDGTMVGRALRTNPGPDAGPFNRTDPDVDLYITCYPQ